VGTQKKNCVPGERTATTKAKQSHLYPKAMTKGPKRKGGCGRENKREKEETNRLYISPLQVPPTPDHDAKKTD